MTVAWRPPPDLAERLTATAFLTGRSANEIMTEAIGEWLTANEPADIEQVIAARARTSAPKPRSAN